MSEKFNVADIFGENVFNDAVMKERLPKNVYKNLKLAIAIKWLHLQFRQDLLLELFIQSI